MCCWTLSCWINICWTFQSLLFLMARFRVMPSKACHQDTKRLWKVTHILNLTIYLFVSVPLDEFYSLTHCVVLHVRCPGRKQDGPWWATSGHWEGRATVRWGQLSRILRDFGREHSLFLSILASSSLHFVNGYRPSSWHLDRCDCVIQYARDPNGGNMCLFSAATCTSHCKLRSLRANPLWLGLRQRVASLTLDCNGVFEIEA